MSNSIRSKLIRSNVLIISSVFILVLLVVSIISFNANQKNLENTQAQIRNSLIAKGNILVVNNSMALRPMANDNAIIDVRELVRATVDNDIDIVYGIYMQKDCKPWVIAQKENPIAQENIPNVLTDSMSLWAAHLNTPTYRTYTYNGEDVLEFASPIISADEEVLGFIRYGLTTRIMKTSLITAQMTSRKSLEKILIILAIVGACALIAAFIATRQQAARITSPIQSLALSAKKIAGGDYSGIIRAETDDEIGVLSNAFETMRQTVKNYTEHLQELVDEKMQQVRDIMNNIDQGLFTINLDMTINPEYSQRANHILGVGDITQESLQKLFRLNDSDMACMWDWIKLIKEKQTIMRWHKLSKLAPVQELEIIYGDQIRYVRINYQKIINKANVFDKIMILVQDITQSRLIERRMEEERIRHENEVKTILGIVGNPPEIIADFIADTEYRLRQMAPQIENLIGEIQQQSNAVQAKDTSVQIASQFRDLHTIKGNAGTYGFEMLSVMAHESESLLDELKDKSVEERANTLLKFKQNLIDMLGIVEELKKQVKLLSGEQSELVLHISRSKIDHIQNLCDELSHEVKIPPSFNKLAYACYHINYKTLGTLTKKYKDLVQRVSKNLEKDVSFELINPSMEINPKSFDDIDEAIMHILRNALDHGIETNEERQRLGKNKGKISLDYQVTEEIRKIIIQDDGQGIDTDKLVQRATLKSALNATTVASMTEHEKLQLIFSAGLSTADQLSTLSGRGMGMVIALNVITEIHGSLTVESEFGKGTTFTILAPTLSPMNERIAV